MVLEQEKIIKREGNVSMKKEVKAGIFGVLLGLVVFSLILGLIVFFKLYPISFKKNNTQSQQPTTSSQIYSESQAPNQNYITAYGRFVGGVDAHSVEINLINTDYDYNTFELTENTDKTIQEKPIDEGQLIKIQFYINENKPYLSSIEKVDKVTLRGYYIGAADENFSEFKFDNKYVVLQIPIELQDITYKLGQNAPVEVRFKNNPVDLKSNPIVEGIWGK